MPKYEFECVYCTVRFQRVLKIGDHTDHPCPECAEPAPRIMEGFAFQFAQSAGASPGNTGVHDLDYPTADKMIGRDTDVRREVLLERDKAKNDLRAKAGTKGLSRVNHKDGTIEYNAMGKSAAAARRQGVDEAVKVFGPTK